MSYTILTVPFDLREKSEGEYLKREFLVDTYLKLHFPKHIKAGSSFLDVIEFNDSLLKSTIARILLIKRGANRDQLLLNKNEFNLFKNPSFISKVKYLPSVPGYYKIVENEFNSKNSEKSDLVALTDTLINELRFYVKGEDSQVFWFKLSSMKLVINRPFSNEGLGFGFLTFQLDWIEKEGSSQAKLMRNLASASNFYRWYNNPNDQKTLFYHDSCDQETWNRKLTDKASKVKINVDELKIINETENYEVNGVFLHEIANEVLQEFLMGLPPEIVFNFNENEKIKPFILHLFQTDKRIERTEIEDSEQVFLSDIYRTLRVPDSRNVPLSDNLLFDFEALSPDSYTQIYSISEGAVVIKGNNDLSRKKEMVNDFYPAFLFALNQRQLFHYCQGRINSMEVSSNGRFEPNQLRRLRGLMVKAEFNQVFSAISNYHEIDSFYEDLRLKFKINEMRDEYLKSINGLESIARISTEKEFQQRSEQMNGILFILTLAQVWTGVYGLLSYDGSWKWYLNMAVYIVFVLFILKKMYFDLRKER
jgi:hypothetical protein